MSEFVTTTFVVNGEERTVAHAATHTLLEVLREECGLTGTKHGCELGECGTCTILMEGQPVLACLVLAQEAAHCDLQTVEGMSLGDELHPLQKTFADLGAAQCGYCTPGMLLTARHLLETEPDPDLETIKEALSGNLCRCTGYYKILEAVQWAGRIMRGDPDPAPPPEVFRGMSLPGEATHV